MRMEADSGARVAYQPPQDPPPPPPPPPRPAPAQQPDGVDAPPSQQPAVDPYTHEEATKDAKALFEATEEGMTGLGTDEDKIWRTLEGKSAAEIDALRKVYKDEYHKDLDGLLRDELDDDKDDLAHLEGLLKGKENQAETDAVKIHAEMDGVFGDEEEVLKLIEKGSPAERQALAAAYAKKYGAPAGEDPQKFLLAKIEGDGNFDGAQKERARALLGAAGARSPEEARRLEAEAAAGRIKVAVDGWGTDEGTLREMLKGKSKQQIDDMARAYQDKFGHSLRDRLVDELSGGEKDEILSMFDAGQDGGKDPRVVAEQDAARIKEAVDGMGTDEDKIRDILGGKSKEQIQELAAAYQDKYGHSLRDRLVEESEDGAEEQEILSLFDAGKDGAKDPRVALERDAARLKQAVDGMGTDEETIREVLQSKSKPEIDELARIYKDKYGHDLRQRLDDEVDGREQKELIEQAFDLGKVDPNDPNAANERARRLREQQATEQGFGLSLVNGIQETFKGESDETRLDRNLDRAEAAAAAGDKERANQLVGYAENDFDSLKASKDEAAEVVATGAAVVASTAVVIGTAGAATPLVIAAAAGAAGAVAGGTGYAVVQGDAADPADIAKQAALGGATGATAVVGAGAGVATRGAVAVGTRGASTVGREAVEQAATAGARQVVTTGGKQVATEAGEQAAATAGKQAAATAGKEAAATAGKETAATAGKEAAATAGKEAAKPTLREVALDGAWQGAKGGAAGGAADGAVRTATESETWEDGLAAGLWRVASNAAVSGTAGALLGAPTGAGLSVGLSAAGRALSNRTARVVDDPVAPGETVSVQRLRELQEEVRAKSLRSIEARDQREVAGRAASKALHDNLGASVGGVPIPFRQIADHAFALGLSGLRTTDEVLAKIKFKSYARQLLRTSDPKVEKAVREIIDEEVRRAQAVSVAKAGKLRGPEAAQTVERLIAREVSPSEALRLVRTHGADGVQAAEVLAARKLPEIPEQKAFEILDTHGVDGVRVFDSLTARGIPAPEVSRIVDQHGLQGAKALDELIAQGAKSTDAREVLDEFGAKPATLMAETWKYGKAAGLTFESAKKVAREAQEVEKLARSGEHLPALGEAADVALRLLRSGRLENPERLGELFHDIASDARPNLTLVPKETWHRRFEPQGNQTVNYGTLQELILAEERATAPGATGKVTLGISPNALATVPGRGKVPGGADVLDHSRKEAISLKEVSSDFNQVRARVIKGVEQLGGSNNKEFPPDGYLRTVEVRIREPRFTFKGSHSADTWRASREEILAELRKDTALTGNGENPMLTSWDLIRVKNGSGTFEFKPSEIRGNAAAADDASGG
jgi:hypothetical protein